MGRIIPYIMENKKVFETTKQYMYIWVNYNILLSWIKAIWRWFPLLTMISSEGEQWGRSEVVIIYPDICIIIIYPTKITGMLQIPAASQIEMATSSPVLSRWTEVLGTKKLLDPRHPSSPEIPAVLLWRFSWDTDGRTASNWHPRGADFSIPSGKLTVCYWKWPFIGRVEREGWGTRPGKLTVCYWTWP